MEALENVRAWERTREITALREELRKLEQERINSLPFATDEQLDQVLAAAREEESMPEGYHETFRLSKAQGKELAKVRSERRAWCMANRGGILKGLRGHDLVSCKVRVTEKSTKTTLRFEKERKTK